MCTGGFELVFPEARRAGRSDIHSAGDYVAAGAILYLLKDSKVVL